MPAYQALTRPAFRPLRKRQTVLGLGGAEWLKVAATIAVGFALTWALELWTHTIEAPVPALAQQTVLSEYMSCAKALDEADARAKAAGADDISQIDLGESEAAAVARARELGLEPGMSEAEIRELVPTTEMRDEPVVSIVFRIPALIILPAAIVAILNADIIRNSSLLKEARRWMRNQRRQHVFVSERRAWLYPEEDAR